MVLRHTIQYSTPTQNVLGLEFGIAIFIRASPIEKSVLCEVPRSTGQAVVIPKENKRENRDIQYVRELSYAPFQTSSLLVWKGCHVTLLALRDLYNRANAHEAAIRLPVCFG